MSWRLRLVMRPCHYPVLNTSTFYKHFNNHWMLMVGLNLCFCQLLTNQSGFWKTGHLYSQFKRKKIMAKNIESEFKTTNGYFPILCTTHSRWHRGHRLFCWTQSDIQQLWKEWLHSPQTTTQSSCLLSAWQRRQASITITRQIAQVSETTSHDHMATAFHFLRVNKLLLALFESSSSLSLTYWSSAIECGLKVERELRWFNGYWLNRIKEYILKLLQVVKLKRR